jgi:RHS repeat-associated protein
LQHHSRYDAFGEKIGGTGDIANKYLFAGEQYDSNLGDYYLRARYYNADSGRFTRRDDFEGGLGVPLTLHKYIYAGGNPVNGVDPSGFYTQADGYAVEDAVEDLYRQERPIESQYTWFGRTIRVGFREFNIPGPLSGLKPDILNLAGFFLFSPGARGSGFASGPGGLFNEIKPLSPSGVAKGLAQMAAYTAVLSPFNVDPDPYWHEPSNFAILPNFTLPSNGRPVLIFNVGGLIFYTDNTNQQMQNALQAISTTDDVQQASSQLLPLLLMPSNSSVNELARGKYLIDSANNTLTAINYALLIALIGVAAYTARYAF